MAIKNDLTKSANPCFECGQCCQHFRVSFYHGEIEGNGAGIVPAQLTSKVNAHLACMKGTEKGGAPCIALKYSEAEGWRCSIYERRPSPCREFNILSKDGTPNPKCQKLQEKAKATRQAASAGKTSPLQLGGINMFINHYLNEKNEDI